MSAAASPAAKSDRAKNEDGDQNDDRQLLPPDSTHLPAPLLPRWTLANDSSDIQVNAEMRWLDRLEESGDDCAEHMQHPWLSSVN
jgi:hypothetical protein